MKRHSMHFCPSCGGNWEPNPKEAFGTLRWPKCKKCDVRVVLSWVAFLILGILLAIPAATAAMQGAGKASLIILSFFGLLSIARAVEQYKASKGKPPSGEQTH